MTTVGQYVTYRELGEYLGVAATETADDSLLKAACRAASAAWDRWTFRRFLPVKETRYYDHPDGDARVLVLHDDLLEVVTFTTQNGGVTLDSGDYYLMCGAEYNATPYDRIAMKRDGDHPNLLYSGTVQKANAVTGIWGYHEEYGSAWQSTNDTLAAAITTTTATTFTVADADGAALYGVTPRFRVGHLLKIDSEYLYVTGVNTSTNTLTVLRGVNGTTAATHLISTAVSAWATMADVWEAARELAAYLYRLKDSQVFDVIASPGTGEVTIPKGVPAGVKLAVAFYRKEAL